MFRKYPYSGWLLLAIACVILLIWSQREQDAMVTPEKMAGTVQHDVQRREQALNNFLKKERLIQRMFSDSLTAAEVETISQEPFLIYAFEKSNILLFWNSNIVVSNCDSTTGEGSLYQNNGWYYRQCVQCNFLKDGQYLVVLFPIATHYPVENEYLQSGFAAASYIPSDATISDVAGKGFFPIKGLDGRTRFYLGIEPSQIQPLPPDGMMVLLIIIGLLAGCIWIQLIAIRLSIQRHFAGLVLVLLAGAVIILGTDPMIPALHLDESLFFSPRLYASFQFFPSLGHLAIHLFVYNWVIVYTAWLLKERYLARFQRSVWQSAICLLSGAALLLGVALFTSRLIRSLVLDSQLEFDLVNFYATDWHTLVSIAMLALAAGLTLLVLFVVNRQLNILERWWMKYGAIGFVFAAWWFTYGGDRNAWDHWLLPWLLFSIFLMDVKPFPKRQFSNTEKIIYYCIYLVLCVTPLTRHLVLQKEERTRLSFIRQVVHERNEVFEFLIPDMRQVVSRDAALKQYFRAPYPNRTNLTDSLYNQYFQGAFSNYAVSIKFFDTLGRPVYNNDAFFLADYQRQVTDTTRQIGYVPHSAGGYHYLTIISINDSGRKLGAAVVELMPRRGRNSALYPELLQPARPGRHLQTDYTYAVYVNHALEIQTDNHPFPLYLRNDTLKPGGRIAYNRDDYVVYRYTPHRQTTVMMIQFSRPVLSWITTCSFILIALVLLSLLVWGGGYSFRSVFVGRTWTIKAPATLRGRIFLAVPTLVFLAFLTIGITTWSIFKDRNLASNKLRLRHAMHTVSHLILNHLNNRQIATNYQGFSTLAGDAEFQNYIATISESRGADINVYDSLGSLMATSQRDIYTKGLLAGIMSPEAYHTLTEEEKAVELQEESIGKLNYLSCYVPLRNATGKAYGYLNVPSFSSGRELNSQISNVLVALIDVYVFMLLVSIGATFFIANRLTKGLKMIIEHFSQYDLGKNEEIVWHYEDEIGQMVAAYNENLKKVKQAIRELARSERESAWREMARQVAHEIKNPLTPMKLNIQMLEMALREQRPNVLALTERVSASLLEQIDSLAHIASAFSDFAKMPEAEPEPVLLNDVLDKAVELYQHHPTVQVQLELPVQALVVFTDRSQLLRVLNNLLKNAIDAMPDDHDGQIEVTLKDRGDHALIAVKDNGVGIPEDVVEKIFSPYFTTKGSGTGLGLAMSRRIIEFWKGRIWFETQEGTGTIFFVQLPIVLERDS